MRAFKILSIEAKDLYGAMQSGNQDGYSIRGKEGQLRESKFTNTLDWSLDSIQLEDVYEKVTRRKDFSFRLGKHHHTQVVINVKFKYSYKEFNKVGRYAYVRAGYNIADLVFSDGVCISEGKLLAIQTNVEVQEILCESVLGRYFKAENGKYVQVGNIPVLMNKSELRQYLYQHGFVCDGVRYVRYKRSSGSSRVGKCLFVHEVVAARMERWDRCGLSVSNSKKIDLAAWEAYIALPMSSIIDTLEIQPHEILVIDDFDSVFEDEVIAVDAPNGELVSQRKRAEIRNSIWDGQSLLDQSLFEYYQGCGMLVLRNRFFKTCAFNTNIQQWFEDNRIYSVEQLAGKTLATDISQIKLITTPNSIKYLKFGTLDAWLENIDSTFGIVKHEKETHYFDGRMVQTHYQLLNTLQLSHEQVGELLKPSLEYLNLLRSDIDVLRYHVKFAFPTDDEFAEPIRTRNDIVFKMLGVNNRFADTKIFKEFRNHLIRGSVRNMKRGHIFVRGNYSTLFGNPLEMLKAAIGRFDGRPEMLAGSICCKKFEHLEDVLCSRSPHITMGNNLIVTNIHDDWIDKYFNLSNEIVCVNAIGENFSQRLNGCDYDSDAMLLTNDKLLLSAARRNYDKFLVPSNFVEGKKISRVYSAEDKADLDIKTSVNKIGDIVNFSQLLNSLFWQRIHDGESIEDCAELYEDICKMAVLSGVEIDRAKKEVSINSQKEIDKLATKYRMTEYDQTVKPAFFKMIAIENGYTPSKKTNYKQFNTPMDHLQKIITAVNFEQSQTHKRRSKPFMDLVKKPGMNACGGAHSIQRDKILKLVQEADADIQLIMKRGKDKDGKPKRKKQRDSEVSERIQRCVDAINRFNLGEYAMYLALKEIDKAVSDKFALLLFEVLFSAADESFFSLIKNSKEPLSALIEDDGGDIKIYDYSFKKV